MEELLGLTMDPSLRSSLCNLVVLMDAAADYSGAWNLLLFFPLLRVYFLVQALLVAGPVFFPLWITIIVVLAGAKLFFQTEGRETGRRKIAKRPAADERPSLQENIGRSAENSSLEST